MSEPQRLDRVSLPPPKWWRGWGALALLPSAVFVLVPSGWPRWVFMWALAVAIYAGCKWLTWRRTPVPEAPPWKHAAYLLAWPGLDAASFLDPEETAEESVAISEWLFASGKLAAGAGVLFGGARMIPSGHPYVAGWVGMIGLVMMLHFGLFHLLSCAWRQAGVRARPLMNRPLASTSLSEFWGRRWNTAFRDLTYRFLFRPARSWFGARWGVVAGFLFSGVVHDLVISVPAGGGYGGPTLFFAAQGAAMILERSAFGRRAGLGQGRTGWLFAMVMLIGPVGLLFHRPFVVGIIVPFLKAAGAL